MQREPPPFVWAVPDEKNILIWNYIIRGPPDSPFAGGEYHGVLIFPPEYPFKPPGIKMLTPSGRFQPDRKICFSMSDFHPGTWNPAWSVATILTGLLSFMLADEMTTGSVTTTDADKRAYAARSHAWNIEQRRFKEAFPDFCTPIPRELPNMGEKERGVPDTASSSSTPAARSSTTSSLQLTNVNAIGSANTAARPARINPTTFAAVPSLTQASIDGIARSTSSTTGGTVTTNGGTAGGANVPTGWSAAWRQVLWEKWRWGALLALAVIVSRLSSA